MLEPSAFSAPVVYQLRVILRGISPLICAVCLSAATVASHTTLQIALSWSDELLNHFVIHGTSQDLRRHGPAQEDSGQRVSSQERRRGPGPHRLSPRLVELKPISEASGRIRVVWRRHAPTLPNR